MIFYFKELSTKLNWHKSVINKRSKKSVEPIGISKLKQVIVSKERPKQLSFRTSFNVDYEILITRKGKSNVNVKKYALSKVYSNTQGLT